MESIVLTVFASIFVLVVLFFVLVVLSFILSIFDEEPGWITLLIVIASLFLLYPPVRDNVNGRNQRNAFADKMFMEESLKLIKETYPDIPFQSCFVDYVHRKGVSCIEVIKSVIDHKGSRYTTTIAYERNGLQFFFKKPELDVMTIRNASVESSLQTTKV